MPRPTKSKPAPTKKPVKRTRSKAASKPARHSGTPFVLVPLLFVFAVAAVLFGANCQQQKGTIGTPGRPIGSVVRPRINGPALPPPVAEPKDRTARTVPPPANSTPAEEQMLLGNPDSATGDASNREHFLIQRAQYALSYNDGYRFPNWVSWHLSAKDIGDTDRGAFVPDPDLPGNFTRIVTSDYNKTGYDRGHNCPSKDRTASREENDIAFYMTNITPQRHEMNAGPWEKLESYCRELARAGNELYIICGHGFKDQKIRRISAKKIAVPDFGWKIVVVLPEQSGNDRARINRNSRVIAVQMPNVKGISKQPWSKYSVTVGEIERATGLHFFDTLPQATAEALKTKQDSGE